MKKKITSAAQGGAYHIEQPNESANNNNSGEDSATMNSIMNKFTELEVVFMLNHLNRSNALGAHVTKHDLKTLPVVFMLKFISNIRVAEFGKAVSSIIQLKLINNI